MKNVYSADNGTKHAEDETTGTLTGQIKAEIKPNFLIIGAPRCGTTYLAQNLATHPDIFVATGDDYDIAGDVHFFDPNTPEGRNNQDKGKHWYYGLFAGAENVTAVGEKTADYLIDRAAPDLIARELGNPALIVMIRDPVERAWSHFCHSRHRLPPLTRFTDIVHLGRDIAGVPILHSGLYARLLEPYIQHFGQENILILVKEDLDRNAATELARVCSFLGVAPDYSFPHLQTYINAGSPNHLASMAARVGRSARIHFPRIYRWLVKGPLSRPVQLLIRTSRRKSNRRTKESMTNTMPLDSDLRRKLKDYYQSDVNDIGRQLGRNLDMLWWDDQTTKDKPPR